MHVLGKLLHKYIRALEKDAVPDWGLTVQNDPMSTQRWDGHFSSPRCKKNYKFIKLETTAHSSFYEHRWKNCCGGYESIQRKDHL